MRFVGLLLVGAILGAGPAAAQKSLDDVDTGRSESLDDVDDGASESPDDVPDAQAGSPDDDVVGAQRPDVVDSESLDAADTGASETSDEVEAAALAPAPAPPAPLPPAPPISDTDFAAQADAANARVAQATSNLAYWDHRYADMIRLDRPTGAARVALIASRDRARADLADAQQRVAEVTRRADAAGQPLP